MSSVIQNSYISSKKRLGFYLAMAGVAFLLVFTIGEAAVRIFLPSFTIESLRKRSLQYSPAILVPYMLEPNQTIVLDTVRSLEINEHGYRGKSFSLEKPAGVVRIVVLGGSAAFDQIVGRNQDWPHLIERDLKTRGYGNVQMVNAAVPGYASCDALGRLYGQVWMLEPDYVLLYNAWNDMKYFRNVSPETPLVSTRSKFYDVDPRFNYHGVVDRLLGLSEMYSQMRLRYLNWKLKVDSEGVAPEGSYANTYSSWATRQYKLNIQLFVDTCRNIGATPVLLTQATLISSSNSTVERARIGYRMQKLTHDALVRAYEQCNQIVRNVAKEKESKLIDIDIMLSGKGELFKDHVHHTPKGGEEVAKIISEFFAREFGRMRHKLSNETLQNPRS